jgi:arylsulfatase A-like enzyme
VDGASLLPLIRGEQVDWRPHLHGEHCTCYSEEQEMQYLTDGNWKYIWFPRLGTEQLFHLVHDPGEKVNLAANGAYIEALSNWRQELVRVLSPREAGLTAGDQLVCQAGKPYLLSPASHNRIRRATP